MDSVNDTRDRFGEGGMLSQFKALRTPSNRKRIFIGVMVFIFMQFAGSNAINYYRLASSYHSLIDSPVTFQYNDGKTDLTSG